MQRNSCPERVAGAHASPALEKKMPQTGIQRGGVRMMINKRRIRAIPRLAVHLFGRRRSLDQTVHCMAQEIESKGLNNAVRHTLRCPALVQRAVQRARTRFADHCLLENRDIIFRVRAAVHKLVLVRGEEPEQIPLPEFQTLAIHHVNNPSAGDQIQFEFGVAVRGERWRIENRTGKKKETVILRANFQIHFHRTKNKRFFCVWREDKQRFCG